jgi:hypothetical protein
MVMQPREPVQTRFNHASLSTFALLRINHRKHPLTALPQIRQLGRTPVLRLFIRQLVL